MDECPNGCDDIHIHPCFGDDALNGDYATITFECYGMTGGCGHEVDITYKRIPD